MAETRNEGVIVQIIGVVLDIDFSDGHLPEIYHALKYHVKILMVLKMF